MPAPGHEQMSPLTVPPAVQQRLREECRIMQGLAQACVHFGTHLPEDGSQSEELFYAVAAEWEKIYDILLWVSGQERWQNMQPWSNGARILE